MKEALLLGVDVVGGHLSIGVDTIRQQTDTVFRLATAFDRDIDAHVDHDIDRDYATLSEHDDGKRYPNNLGVVTSLRKRSAKAIRGGLPPATSAASIPCRQDRAMCHRASPARERIGDRTANQQHVHTRST